MPLASSDLSTLLNKIYSLIDNEIDPYFGQVENTLLAFINKDNNIYNLQKKDIIKEAFYNEDFEEFFLNLISQISYYLNSYYFESVDSDFHIDFEYISQIHINSNLYKEYGFSYFLAKNIEKNINKVIQSNKSVKVLNEIAVFFMEGSSLPNIILSSINMSSKSFNKRHKVDIERRVKGILLNLKVRLKTGLKSRVYKHILSLQNNNIMTA